MKSHKHDIQLFLYGWRCVIKISPWEIKDSGNLRFCVFNLLVQSQTILDVHSQLLTAVWFFSKILNSNHIICSGIWISLPCDAHGFAISWIKPHFPNGGPVKVSLELALFLGASYRFTNKAVSTKSLVVLPTPFWISFIWMKNRWGSKTVPCGVPLSIGTQSEDMTFTTTHWVFSWERGDQVKEGKVKETGL